MSCPEIDIDLWCDDIPSSVYAELRQRAPVFFMPGYDAHVATRYDEVRTVMAHRSGRAWQH